MIEEVFMLATESDSVSPSVRRWQSAAARRYYEVRVIRDLWGELHVLRVWGAIGTVLGGERRDAVPDGAGALLAIERIAKRREQRGYLPAPT